MTKTLESELTEVDKLIKFRYEWLKSVGYTRRNANLIASALEINWHTAYDMRKYCEDEDLIMRILF